MKTIEGKLVMLGASGVGKTSLIVRYIEKTYGITKETVGASFFNCCVNLPNAKVKLQIWDTAGQERFKSMIPMYYRNANVAFLVFDITNYSSFITVKSWVNELNRSVENIIIFVVIGNKNDLEADRKIPYEEAFNYASSIDAPYYEVSALLDDGINMIFLNTAKNLQALSTGEYGRSGNLRIYDLDYSINDKDGLQVPFKEECLDASIAEGIRIKPFCC